MKKLLFAFMAIALIGSASSCKKCGYCKYNNGQSNSSAVCKNSTLAAVGADEYQQAEADCQAQGGSWQLTK
mgnify:CR=1 FL=1